MPKVVSRTQASLAVVTGAMMLATAYSATRIPVREQSLFDLTRDAGVAETRALISDLTAFEAAVDGYSLAPGPRAATEVARHLGVIRAALATLELHNPDQTVIDATGVAASAGLDVMVDQLQPLVADLDRPGDPAKIAGIVAALETSLDHIAFTAFDRLGVVMAVAATPLRSAYDLLIGFAAASLLGCLALLFTLSRSNRNLHGLARRDALTGLHNRLTFSETLSRLIRDPGAGNEVALMLLDVDLFKNINDSLGHAVGDRVLQAIAQRLNTLVMAGVYLSRLGGDEFAMILTVRQSHRTARDTVDKITRLIAEPIELGGKSITVSVSIGVALQSMHLSDAATMLKNADLALYAAKKAGRGRFRFFNVKMDREFRGRREMEDALREAVRAEQLELHFQPMVDLKTQEIVSCEALLRWNRPAYGPVPPMTFITLAEEIGLIQEIGDWVLRQACTAARSWPEDVRVSINLSPHQFDGDGFVSTFTRVLAETGLAADRVELEITETLLLRDSHSVLQALAALRALGVQIALDDFGTGYSSLSYLQRFAIDRIKIDQSFVRNMTHSVEATAIAESICLLAAKLKIATTGEGIETEADAALLRTFGCQEGQGYLFDRPMPLQACTARIHERRLRKVAA